MLVVMLEISTPAYQFWLVGRIECTRKITQRPFLRALSIAVLNGVAASPPPAATVGRLKGSVLSRGAICPPDTPRFKRKRLRAGSTQPPSPNGEAMVHAV